MSTDAMTDDERDDIYETFTDRVNMQPKELEEWLETEPSKEAGDSEGDEESTGHASGRRIVEIKRTKKADLSDDDYEHMQKVNGYIARHLAQRPDGDVAETTWCHSLKNWGHDPTKSSD